MRLGLGLSLGGGATAALQYLFNGLDTLGFTFTRASTQVVADNEGTLVSVPAGIPAIEGMRWATTIAEGATLGEELVTNGGLDTDLSSWILSAGGGVVWSDGVAILTYNTASIAYMQQNILSAGKTYLCRMDILPGSTGTFQLRVGGVNYVYDVVDHISAGFIEVSKTSAGADFRIYAINSDSVLIADNISVREVIPRFVDTDSLGDPLYTPVTRRTANGNVIEYTDPTYLGYLGEGARTNLFLNSTAPVTQDITTTAQDYTISVLGTGDVTVSGTATGTATEGSPLTVTATAGTLTCTVTGTLSRVQVEAGSYGTSWIDTAGTTVTRAATVLSKTTANVLRSQNWGLRLDLTPIAAGQTGYALASYTDADNETSVYVEPTQITFRKRVATVDTDCTISYTHVADTRVLIDIAQDETNGMGIRYSDDDGATWSDWTGVGTAAGKADAVIASTMQYLSREGADHFNANLSSMAVPVFSDTPRTALEELT